MLQAKSVLKLDELESVMRRAVQRQGAHLLTVTHLGQLLRDRQHPAPQDVLIFVVCHPALSASMLAADIRLSAFLPSRIAAWSDGQGTALEAMPPREFCRVLDRRDLEDLALPLETVLSSILAEVAQPPVFAAHAAAHTSNQLGAREDQMNVRGSIPQRIDCKGSKVEDLAGTGEHDAAGG